MKTGSYQFAADISSVDAKKRQMTLTVYGYDAYRAEDMDALDVGKRFQHPSGRRCGSTERDCGKNRKE